MRRSWLFGVFGGAVTMSAPLGCEPFYYCSRPRIHQRSPIWSHEGYDGDSDIEVPVDAAPWLLRSCDNRTIPPGCALVAAGMEIRVRLELTGQDACNLGAGETVLPDGPAVIQRLQPRDPLPPGTIVTLDCGDADDPTGGYYYWNPDNGYFDYSYSWGTQGPVPPLRLRVRDSDEPAAPPGELAVLELQYTRGDPYLRCSEDNDALEVKVDFEAQFLREGGYVEVVYPNGEVFQFSRPGEGGVAVLPGSRGPLQFTPVAIDGERGETVEVAAGSIDEELVYVPSCAVRPEGGDGGAAALLTLTVLAVARRRRTGEDAR